MKFKSKPKVIDAIQWTGKNGDEIFNWAEEMSDDTPPMYFDPNGEFKIETLEGDHIASIGDWIICGIHGEFYPCKPDIFSKSYEVLDAQES